MRCVIEDALEILIRPCPPLRCWGDRCVPPCPASAVLKMEHRALCVGMLYKYFTTRAASPAPPKGGRRRIRPGNVITRHSQDGLPTVRQVASAPTPLLVLTSAETPLASASASAYRDQWEKEVDNSQARQKQALSHLHRPIGLADPFV